jgi:hypothetical protein
MISRIRSLKREEAVWWRRGLITHCPDGTIHSLTVAVAMAAETDGAATRALQAAARWSSARWPRAMLHQPQSRNNIDLITKNLQLTTEGNILDDRQDITV